MTKEEILEKAKSLNDSDDYDALISLLGKAYDESENDYAYALELSRAFINKGNSVDEGFPFYVKEIGNNQKIQEIKLNYNNNYKSLYEKLKYAKMPKSRITDQYETITLNNKTYLLIKRDEYSDKFLENIEIQYKNVQ